MCLSCTVSFLFVFIYLCLFRYNTILILKLYNVFNLSVKIPKSLFCWKTPLGIYFRGEASASYKTKETLTQIRRHGLSRALKMWISPSKAQGTSPPGKIHRFFTRGLISLGLYFKDLKSSRREFLYIIGSKQHKGVARSYDWNPISSTKNSNIV